MGCDVHMYMEYRPKQKRNEYDSHWHSFGGQINPGRNYAAFEALAGVRGEDDKAVTLPRGFPDDAGWAAREDNHCFISETKSDNYVTRARAEQWIASGSSKPYKKDWVTNPDWHSHSWLMLPEYEAALNKVTEGKMFYGVGEEYWAIAAALRELEKHGNEARVVFWFDN